MRLAFASLLLSAGHVATGASAQTAASLLMPGAPLSAPAPGPTSGTHLWTRSDFLPPLAMQGAPTPTIRLAMPEGPLVEPDDYPPIAIRNGEEGLSVAGVTVNSEGVGTRCWIVTSSGSDALDRASCRAALTSARWRPATNQAGKPVQADLRLPMRWVLPR